MDPHIATVRVFVIAIRVVVALGLGVLACSDAPRGSVADSPSTRPQPANLPAAFSLPSTPGADWALFRGDGFTLRYPVRARVRPDSVRPERMVGTAILGPDILFDTARAELRPTYRLLFTVLPNRAGRSGRFWVDSVRKHRNVGRDSIALLGPESTIRIGTLEAWELSVFCGDCEASAVYVVGPTRTVVFSLVYDISIPGNRDAQEGLYKAIMSTFRWAD